MLPLSKPFNPSPQQLDFFQWILTGTGSCVLEAVAGSGKTTTLVVGLEKMTGYKFFGAYNKKIAEEIAKKTSHISQLDVSTFHAAGFRAWKRVNPKSELDSNKCRGIYRKLFTSQEAYALESVVLSLVSYAKQAAIGINGCISDVSAWYKLIDHFNVDTQGEDEAVVDAAMTVLDASVKLDPRYVDFDDMIFSPLFHNIAMPEYDWVLIDEAQDTNASRRALALRMLKRGGRLVAVGDRHQAIYGFTGADADALDLIANAVDAIRMPLTVTYRCPLSVVKEAQKYVSHIIAHESATEGSVTTLQGNIIDSAKVGDAILCRFNAPLVSLVFSFIGNGIPAKIEGREIGAQIKTLVRRYKSKTFSVLIERLDGYRQRECAKLRAKEQESQAVAVEDKVNCIKVIIARVQAIDPKSTDPINRVCQEIDTIFDNDVNTECVTLSSIHKAKGREWTNVYWLQTGGSKWARMQWEHEQEKNLKYVAITRAQENLILVPMEQKEKTQMETAKAQINEFNLLPEGIPTFVAPLKEN